MIVPARVWGVPTHLGCACLCGLRLLTLVAPIRVCLLRSHLPTSVAAVFDGGSDGGDGFRICRRFCADCRRFPPVRGKPCTPDAGFRRCLIPVFYRSQRQWSPALHLLNRQNPIYTKKTAVSGRSPTAVYILYGYHATESLIVSRHRRNGKRRGCLKPPYRGAVPYCS